MKLAVLGEGETDEAVARVLVEAILGRACEPVAGLSLASRGWPSIRGVLPTVVKHLHYRTDAEAVVVLVDSNHSMPHDAAHDAPAAATDDCRLCRVRSLVERTLETLAPVSGRSPIKVAVGLPVPTLEAWLRCGLDPNVGEAAWIRGLREKKDPVSKIQLKREVYGTDRIAEGGRVRRAAEEARRVAANLSLLERTFPGGFGTLATEVRGWGRDSIG